MDLNNSLSKMNVKNQLNFEINMCFVFDLYMNHLLSIDYSMLRPR